jgi:preprotein translocase subunit SecA
MQVGACGGALRTPFQQGGGSGATENRVARNSAGVSGAAMPHMVPSVPSDPFWLHTMFDELLTKIFGSRNDRLIKQYRRKCDAINKLEPAMQALSDEELKAKTQEFRDRIAKGATTDELLPEAFAVVREASVRVLGMRHFDVQLIGAMVLNDGKIAEMRTGEGKTLTATLAVYLNALPGKGCHVVTVNDYLASRDADWMGRLYNWLGLSVGKILSNQNNEEKRAAYASDITYGTNNEFGFDYLRDNMEYDVAARRQRPLYYAIVDEVDSILIDEARTPLIISGPADDNTELYRAVNDIPPLLTRQAEEKGEGDYWVDEKAHQVYLSEAGHEHLEQILSERGLVQQGESLYAPKNIILMHHLNAALRAHTLFHRDQHYVVQNGEIVIVDEFTGRLMPGRRWSEGLHQAVEAKEGVKIQQENQTMASITFQNFFRMYGKLSGMTGTADTEAYEFQDIYGLETVVVPTHRKMVRIDEQDKVYRTVNEKYRAIIDDVKACYERRQPVLLGTTSIENSELLSSMLTKEGIPHNVLNAKQHDREAQIVLEAGRPGVVTIATNMAGRGTDIVLGGGINKAVDAIRADETLTEEQREAKIAEVKAEWQKLHDIVVEAGGLRIIGSERHESRRIDNQLRGRAGRQGDPGSSCFYLSMEDQLLRIFGGDRMRAIADKLRLEEGEAIESKMLTRMIESAQRKVEGRNYDIRKQLLEFDDVQNDQRHEIYGLRNQILESEDISELVKNLREGLFTDLFRAYVPAETVEEQWDLDGLQTKLAGEFGIVIDFKQLLDSNDQFTDDDLLEALLKQAEAQYVEKEQMVGHEAFTGFARSILLQILDQLWRQHISALEALRQGIYLRGYAQKQPKQEYKREAFNMFEQLLDQIRETLVRVLMQVQINVKPAEEPAQQQPVEEPAPAEATGSALENMPKEELDPALFAHVGRNDLCPCGSGRRFKDCHGRLS